MNTSKIISVGLLAASLTLGTSFAPGGVSAQYGREPLACMNFALEYAVELTEREGIDALLAAQRKMLESLNTIAGDESEPPSARLKAAQRLLGSRESRDLERTVRAVQRTHDKARSTVAGWRGLYCPVATPDGGRGLSGQERCDAFAATFVDRLRIDQRTAEQTRAREALEAERQTILKLPIPRSNRNDLLDLWRIRSENFDALYRLERFQYLQGEARTLISGVEEEGCAQIGEGS